MKIDYNKDTVINIDLNSFNDLNRVDCINTDCIRHAVNNGFGDWSCLL